MSETKETFPADVVAAMRDALLIQDAVNLTAILHSWARHRRNLPAQGEAQRACDVLFFSKTASLLAATSTSVGSVYLWQPDARDGEGAEVEAFTAAYDYASRAVDSAEKES